MIHTFIPLAQMKRKRLREKSRNVKMERQLKEPVVDVLMSKMGAIFPLLHSLKGKVSKAQTLSIGLHLFRIHLQDTQLHYRNTFYIRDLLYISSRILLYVLYLSHKAVKPVKSGLHIPSRGSQLYIQKTQI